MAFRAVRGLSIIAAWMMAWALPAGAQEGQPQQSMSQTAAAPIARQVVTSENADYFGFDLRSEQNVSLDQCKTSCLGDQSCRAFTYNNKAKWCFLKSDFAVLKPFTGATAGKVVPISGDADVGAPPAIAFFPDWMADEARAFRAKITDGTTAIGEEGLNFLLDGARVATNLGDPRTAVRNYRTALAIDPDNGSVWISLARALLAVQPITGSEGGELNRDATSSTWNAYQLLRTAPGRAEALAVMAVGLDRRELFRPALQAYEASLGLVNSAAVRAEYEDLKARKGFRIVDHTVDADTQSPRVCAQFSEDLVKAGVDYATFVTVDNAPPKAVSA